MSWFQYGDIETGEVLIESEMLHKMTILQLQDLVIEIEKIIKYKKETNE
jgi:hypothetical protein